MNPIILSILNLFRGQTEDTVSLSNFNMDIIFNKIAELQNSIGALAIQDGPIASAHVILLAAGVVIFWEWQGKLSSKNWDSRCSFFDDSWCNNRTSIWNHST